VLYNPTVTFQKLFSKYRLIANLNKLILLVTLKTGSRSFLPLNLSLEPNFNRKIRPDRNLRNPKLPSKTYLIQRRYQALPKRVQGSLKAWHFVLNKTKWTTNKVSLLYRLLLSSVMLKVPLQLFKHLILKEIKVNLKPKVKRAHKRRINKDTHLIMDKQI